MGIHGDFGNERVADAYRTMIGAARKHGKFPGMAGVYNETIMPRYIEMGARFVLRRSGRGVHGCRRGPAHRVSAQTLAGLAIEAHLSAAPFVFSHLTIPTAFGTINGETLIREAPRCVLVTSFKCQPRQAGR